MSLSDSFKAAVDDQLFYFAIALLAVIVILMVIIIATLCWMTKLSKQFKSYEDDYEEGMMFANQFALPLPRRNEKLNTDVTPQDHISAISSYESRKAQSTFMSVIISDASKIQIPRARSDFKSKEKSSKTNTDL